MQQNIWNVGPGRLNHCGAHFTRNRSRKKCARIQDIGPGFWIISLGFLVKACAYYQSALPTHWKKYINSIWFNWAKLIPFDLTNLAAHPGSHSCCMFSFELSFWSKILFWDVLQFLPLSKILCCWLYEQRAVCAEDRQILRPYIDKSFIFINLSITSQQLEVFVPARGLIARNARVSRILQRFFSQCYKWKI